MKLAIVILTVPDGGGIEKVCVDLAEEMVSLLTAQRNFQANAKSIETNSAVTQTIIQLR